MKPTIHILCGLPCSGKSTLARKIEKESNAITISQDEWMSTIFGTDNSDLIGLQYAENVSKMTRRTWERIIERKIDVILDDGFGSKASRNQIRLRAKELGANHQLYFLSCFEETLLQRLHKRNDRLKDGEIFIPDWKFKKQQEFFEPPDDDEDFILI